VGRAISDSGWGKAEGGELTDMRPATGDTKAAGRNCAGGAEGRLGVGRMGSCVKAGSQFRFSPRVSTR
jgi:hypothetical protein